MIVCSNCNKQNPADARFCQNCGHNLQQTCTHCATVNAADANFCKNCGQALRVRPPEESKTEPVRAVPARMQEAERRVVTLLFGDVVGSTSVGELIDPEEWTEIMNGMFGRMLPAIERYGGTVARLMGDGFLALFGAPITHEDDPHRAVLAALEMVTALEPYQEKVRTSLTAAGVPLHPDDLAVRIGINTGLVVVGEVGSGDSLEYTAMGDAVNLAARMEQTAEPGTIQIAHDTYLAVNPRIETRPLALLEIKGKREPVQAYRVMGLKRSRDQIRDLPGLASPLIGRETEMKRLREMLATVQAGQGRLLALYGDGGHGKSRLVRELYRLSQDDAFAIRWYEAESLSFESTQPYGLIQRLLRRISSIARDDSPEVIKGKIKELVRWVDPQAYPQMEKALRILFGIERGETSDQLRGEEFKNELFAGMFALGEAMVADQPSILILEDLHWTDSASLELIGHLTRLVETVPLFMVCVFRPYRQSAVRRVMQEAQNRLPDRYQAIELKPLTAEASNDLVGGLLEIKDLPDQIGSLILDKTSGVPYFIEEIVRELIESGALVRSADDQTWQVAADLAEIHIPDNLEAVLVSRMDRLDAETRRILQLAAVIGRSFYLRVLKMISVEPNALDEHMQILQQVGMILEFSRIPEPQYIFQHVLTQEAAYNTILIRHRRQYHQKVGEAMERIFAGQLNEQAPLLAHHFRLAGDEQRALHYFTLAAENAARLYANMEALNLYNEAVALSGTVEVAKDSLAQLYRARGKIREVLGDFDGALRDLEEALRLTRLAENDVSEWQAMLDLGNLWTSRDYNKAGDYYEKALALARGIDDPAKLAQNLNRLGNWNANAEHPQEAIAFHREALQIIERLEDPAGLANTLDLLGMANLLAGDYAAAHHNFDRAVDLFRELGDRYRLVGTLTTRRAGVTYNDLATTQPVEALQTAHNSLSEALLLAQEINWRAGESFTYWVYCLLNILEGQFGTALEMAQEGLTIATAIDHRQWMAGHEFNLAVLYCELLAGDHAQKHARRGFELAEEMGSRYWKNQMAGILAKAHLLQGDLENSRVVLATVLEPSTPMDSHAKRFCWQQQAHLALAGGSTGEALNICDRLLAAIPAKDGEVVPNLWLLRARILTADGQYPEAEILLQETLSAISSGNPSLWQLYAALGDLYTKMIRRAKAEKASAAGREEIEKLAATISDEVLRSEFRRNALDQLHPLSD